MAYKRAASCYGAAHLSRHSLGCPGSGPKPGRWSGNPPTGTGPGGRRATAREQCLAPGTQGGAGGHRDVGLGQTSRPGGHPCQNTHNTPEIVKQDNV